jgi:hypothetical protein
MSYTARAGEWVVDLDPEHRMVMADDEFHALFGPADDEATRPPHE